MPQSFHKTLSGFYRVLESKSHEAKERTHVKFAVYTVYETKPPPYADDNVAMADQEVVNRMILKLSSSTSSSLSVVLLLLPAVVVDC
jgi:hypothetical protein